MGASHGGWCLPLRPVSLLPRHHSINIAHVGHGRGAQWHLTRAACSPRGAPRPSVASLAGCLRRRRAQRVGCARLRGRQATHATEGGGAAPAVKRGGPPAAGPPGRRAAAKDKRRRAASGGGEAGRGRRAREACEWRWPRARAGRRTGRRRACGRRHRRRLPRRR